MGMIASAMCALAGPRHGKANQDCLEFVLDVLEEVGENATAEQVEKLIRHSWQPTSSSLALAMLCSRRRS